MNYRFEIDKLFTLESSLLVPYGSFTYRALITTTTLDAYWVTTFGVSIDLTNKVSRVINSVIVNYTTGYAKQTSIVDCEAQEESFYWDNPNQMLYVHYEHDTNPFAVSTEYGSVLGFTDESVEYVSDVVYKPLLVSVPAISDSSDPLQYEIMAYSDGTFSLKNDEDDFVGEFDTDPKLAGSICRLKRENTTVWEGRIVDYSTTLDTFTVKASDKRRLLQASYPTEVFSGLTGIADDTNGKLIPDGYGLKTQVPAYPVLDGVGAVQFRWGTEVTSITQVYSEKDGIITSVTDYDFLTNGTFNLLDGACASDGADPTLGLKRIYVTGVMRPETNPGDIIADLNLNVLGIVYNASNYNETEWVAEKAKLSDVGLYMDSTKKLVEWIEMLQPSSNLGFRYEDIEKRTLRVDDSNRALTTTLTAIDIRNQNLPADSNLDLYATDCTVFYNKNHRTDVYSQVSNTDYYFPVLREHRVAKTFESYSLLTLEADATEKALNIMEDISEVRPIFTNIIDYNSYTAPRVFDIIQTTQSFGSRAYYGSQRCQVIGVSPIPETDEYRLTLRQRDAQTNP